MSNLLEQASLVMIPSGYKEDIVYSEIPINGSGDLQFTRSSNGTRVNSAGLVEVVPWNLVQQSETFDNAFWSVDNGSITANSTTAPNGTTTADTLTRNASTAYLYNGSFNLGIGEFTQSIYAKANASSSIRLEFVTGAFGRGAACIFDLSNGTAGTLTIYGGVSGFTATIESVGNGWYRCSIGGTITIADTYYYEISITTGSIYIWGAQINVGSTAKPYFPTTDRLNVPRLTYQNGGGGCPSLLLEKQSTNLVTYSEQFDNAAWPPFTTGSGTVNVIANAAISPDGTQNADEIQFTRSALTEQAVIYQTQSASNATYSRTIYLKAARSQDIGKKVDVWSYNGSSLISPISATLTADWQRFDAGTATGGLVEILSFGYLPSALYPTTSGTDVRFYAWGAQGEVSNYATSYIPTTSSSATRVADACFKTGISSLIGQTSGTILWDLQVDQLLSSENILNIDNGSFGDTIYFLKSTAGSILIDVWASGSQQSVLSYSLPSVGRYKIALAYASNDFALYVNGVSRGTDSSGSVPTCSRLQMGNGALGPSDGKVNELVLFPTRLSNSELASLTSL